MLFERYQKDAPRRTVARIQKLKGIKWHFHLLRQYFASVLVERGTDFITVVEILCHSKTMVSLGYAHMSKERKAKTLDLLKLTKSIRGKL